MASLKIFFCCLALSCLWTLEAVKIGVSRHLPTTLAPNITTTLSEEDMPTETETQTTVTTTTSPMSTISITTSESSSTTKQLPNSSTIQPTSTATSATTPEEEWPEFPPRKKPTTIASKSTTSTTTRKPMATKKSKSKMTTTTEMPEASNTTVAPLDPINTSTSSIPRSNKYCFCDMTLHGCDINCCCDPDCSDEALQVFKCLKEVINDFELHEGRFEDFKFQHGLPSCEVNDGWLCVFRTNMPLAAKRVQPRSFDTSLYYQWSNLLKDDIDMENTKNFYVYGDPLKLINMETKDIINFDLPSTLKAPHCQTKEPVRYLKSQKRTCLIPKDKPQTEEIKRNLMELHSKYKILQKPLISDEDIAQSKRVENYVGNISLHWCNTSSRKCQESIKADKKTFNDDFLSKIQIKIFHNFTHIQGAEISLWHESKENDNKAESWLHYDISFCNNTMHGQNNDNVTTKSTPYRRLTSGPLGYTTGKPLLVAKYVVVNKSLPLTEKNRQISYFVDDIKEQNTLPIFKKRKGLCQLPQASEEAKEEGEFLSYGINLAKQCKFRMENQSFTPHDPLNTNYTAICLNLQELIHRQFFGPHITPEDISSYYISQLGKPQNDTDRWTALNVYNADFDPVFGQYMENTRTFICRNILLSLSYEFRVRNLDIDIGGGWGQNQNIVKYANLIMGERHDLEFSSDEHIEVPLTLTVRFFDDINEKAASASNFIRHAIILNIIGLILVLDF
uniref:Uncharacterized protein n=1 Tax=Stomoxys calcitrans TaxID=35570 RepID=A0A1I8NSV9_STOCA